MMTIGSDPEFFISDTRTGNPHPACGMFGGVKGKPVPIPGLGDGFGYQEDNVMLEFNVPPATDPYDFSENIHSAMMALSDLVRTKGDHLSIDNACSRLFARDLLDHPKSREFGCSPDFNAYANGGPCDPVEMRLLAEDTGEWRFAGGHIHLGYDKKDELPRFVVAAFADIFIGLNTIRWDRQGKRREFYGRPGRFRPTPYGMEYRTLSNAWLLRRQRTEQVACDALALLRWLDECPLGAMQEHFVSIPWGDVQQAFITENADWACRLYDELTTRLRS